MHTPNDFFSLTFSIQVWFRKGIKASQAASDVQYVIGNGWVPMVHKMNYLAIGPNDHVSTKKEL